MASSKATADAEASEGRFQSQQAVVSDIKARLRLRRDALAKAEGLYQSMSDPRQYAEAVIRQPRNHAHQEDGSTGNVGTDEDRPQGGRTPTLLVSDGSTNANDGGGGHGGAAGDRPVCDHCLQEIEPDQYLGKLATMRVRFP